MAIERTLILIKPDGVQRGIAGEIISRFERTGMKIVGMKLMQMSPELAAKHYEAHVGKGFYEGLVKFMTSSPLVALAIEGPKAVDNCRKLMGKTFCTDAQSGTIRGDYGVSRGLNLVHGSDSAESAKRELGLFFEASELLEYTRAVDAWTWNDEDKG